MAAKLYTYESPAALADVLAAELAQAIRDAISARGAALLSLAGGRTPLPAYAELALQALPWSRVAIMPGDDRCVPHDHPASNVRELRDAFAPAAGIAILPLTDADGEADASAAEAMLAMHRDTVFDACVLGMGLDAHTASLFPGAAQLDAALDPRASRDALRLDPDPLPVEAPFPRITLTAARLLRSRAIHVVATGAAKRGVLDRAMLDGTDPHDMPIAAFLHARDATVHVHWSP